MDDFREWLSDNLRYILLGAAVLIILLVLFFGIRACTGIMKGNSGDDQAQLTENGQGNVPSSPTMGGETDDEKKESTNVLEKDAYPEVNALVKEYYQALGEKDVTTLRTLVDDLAPADESKITNAKDYIEGYQVNEVYTKKGTEEGDYVVYAYYNFICKGITTPVPALSQLYVRTNSDGKLKIFGGQESSALISNYCETVQADEDVQQLIATVNEAYESAQENDSALKEFLEGLGQDAGTAVTGGEGSDMLVLEDCNVRAAASQDADRIGGLYAGAQVKKTGQDGEWVQIEYDGQTGYVFGELLQEVSQQSDTADGENGEAAGEDNAELMTPEELESEEAL